MTAPESAHRGLGVTAGLDAGLAREMAAHCEQLGYESLWSNDEPAAPGLATVAEFAAATEKVHQPTEIAGEVERLGIDTARLWLGIGAGALSPQIDALQHRGRDAATAVPPRRRDR